MKYHFKFNTDGSNDGRYETISDCFPLWAYCVLKMRGHETNTLLLSQLNHLSYKLTTDIDDNFFSFTTIYEKWNNYLSFETINVESSQVEYVISEFIKEHSYVIVQTVTPLLPFSKAYEPLFKSQYHPAHAFLLLHSDAKFYHFFDDPFLINHQKTDKSYLGPEVSAFDKKILNDIFSNMLYCTRFKINSDELSLLSSKILNCVKMATLRNGKSKQRGEYGVEYHGYEALEKLSKICTTDNIKFTDASKERPLSTVGNRLLFVSLSIRNGKKILKTWLDSLLDLQQAELYLRVVELANRAEDIWGIITNVCLKYVNENKNINVLVKSLSIAFTVEKELNYELIKLIECFQYNQKNSI